MKKLVLLLAAVALFGTSCKKEYTCTCDHTTIGGSTNRVTILINDSKKNAKSICQNQVLSSNYASSRCTLN